nr:hypothetical protein HK105_001638 [Polyrhizophydium stewartii]
MLRWAAAVLAAAGALRAARSTAAFAEQAVGLPDGHILAHAIDAHGLAKYTCTADGWQFSEAVGHLTRAVGGAEETIGSLFYQDGSPVWQSDLDHSRVFGIVTAYNSEVAVDPPNSVEPADGGNGSADGGNGSADGNLAWELAVVDRIESMQVHGHLTGTRYVIRSDTRGGLPPTAGAKCDPALQPTIDVPFTSLYRFYRRKARRVRRTACMYSHSKDEKR